MKQTFSKGVSIVLSAVMCLSLLAMTALAVDMPTKIDAPMNPSAEIKAYDPESHWSNDMIWVTVDIPDSIQPYLPTDYEKVNRLDNGSSYDIHIEIDWSVDSADDWKCTGELMWGKSVWDRDEEIWLDGARVTIYPGLRNEETVTMPMLFSGGIDKYPELYENRDADTEPRRFTEGSAINLRARYRISAPITPYSDEPWITVYSDWTAVFQAAWASDDTQAHTPTEQTPPTGEKPSAWAAEQVTAAIANSLVPQALQSRYTQATTRVEFAALAVALYEQVMGATITQRKTFDDTTDINVEKAAAIGIVSGVGDNRFAPNEGLTREQAAVMLSRLADTIGKSLDKRAATFADNGSIATWAITEVGQIQAAGIMSGIGENTFAPQSAYTREQSIITIQRLYTLLNNNANAANTSNARRVVACRGTGIGRLLATGYTGGYGGRNT